MRTILLFSFAYFYCLGLISGQNWIDPPITDWHNAGVEDSIPDYDYVINILDYGADSTGQISCNEAFNQALLDIGEHSGVVYFPEGRYAFDRSIALRDSVVLRGAGSEMTVLSFDLGGQITDAIQISGSTINDPISIVGGIQGQTSKFQIDTEIDDAELLAQKWFYLIFDDTDLMASSWAYGLGGTIFSLNSIDQNQVYTDQDMRLSIPDSLEPYIIPVNPIKGCGIECLKIERHDSTEFQTSNVLFRYAVDCWVVGVESEWCNFGHIDIRQSTRVTIRGSYFHNAHAFGGGGQAYGVILQSSSSLCLIENNSFRLLRHSILLQSGANGNVIGYNYSTEPFWTGVGLPANSAGDLVCHGNFPYFNLFEGNIVQNIVVDASHGRNGPHNIFHRNRAELYGIFMSPGSGTDSTHFIGNEVTNTGFLLGNYSLIGDGNIEYGNRVRGQVLPEGTDSLLISSLYLEEPPGFWQSPQWPHIGRDNPEISSENPAYLRFINETFTDCTRNPQYDPSVNTQFLNTLNPKVYPNPITEVFNLQLDRQRDLSMLIYDLNGRVLFEDTLLGQSLYSVRLSNLNGSTILLYFMDLQSGETFSKVLLTQKH